jgi:membrane protease subunit HflK
MTEKDKLQDENSAVDSVNLDAGSEALTNALQKAFNILKVVMVVIIVIFLASGFFKVNSGEKALVLSLGKLTTPEPLTEGLHWGWPAPISERIIIPVSKAQVLPIDLFWYFQTPQEKLGGRQRAPGAMLKPGIDGYCLTRNNLSEANEGADYNIVHAKWQLTYMMSRPELFYRNVYYRDRIPGEDFLDVATETVEPMLEAMAGNAIVSTMVKYTIDDAIVSDSRIADEVKVILQEKLRKIQCGISIDSVLIDGKITWPRQVNNAFEASNQVRQMSDKLVTEARSYFDQTLNETGGKKAVDILKELKSEGLGEERKQVLLSQLSGKCQGTISRARADKTKVAKSAEANAIYFESLLPEYRKRPKLVVQKLYQDAVGQVLADADEKIFIEPGTGNKGRQLRIMVNRDPSIKPKKKEDKK